MGLTHIEGTVEGPTGKHKKIRFLVDSGATYSLLPEKIWKPLKIEPKRTISFTLADGTVIDRAVSEAFIKFSKGEGHTPVILGKEGDEALLGAVTLEILGFVLNPFDRTLYPMKMMLC